MAVSWRRCDGAVPRRICDACPTRFGCRDAVEGSRQLPVSRSWVDRVKQRRREAGEIAPRKQTKFRRRALDPHHEYRLVALITARPDATLAELREALPTTAALSTLWRAVDCLGLTVKKNDMLTNNGALMWLPSVGVGRTRSRCTMRAATSSLTSQASRPICCAAMVEAHAGCGCVITRRAGIGRRTPSSRRSGWMA